MENESDVLNPPLKVSKLIASNNWFLVVNILKVWINAQPALEKH